MRQVAAIRQEMEAVKREVGFNGTLEQFFDHIRTDAKFKYPNTDAGREEYLRDTRAVIASVMETALRYFGVLLKASLEVRAVEKWREGTSVADTDIAREVDRHFNWPGQATSYMVGQLKIAELRAQAARELGSRFDIRDFHEAVLSQGSLPLDVLKERVERYIAKRRSS